MAKTKAELEFDASRHHQLMAQARAALKAELFDAAVKIAVSAWQHVDGMMQYDRRWGLKSDFESIDSIEIVLRYAPLLFDRDSLDTLADLLKAQKRIDRNASADIAADLAEANATLRDAYKLWCHLETEREIRQDDLRRRFGGDQDKWRWMAETWASMGLLTRVAEAGSYRLSLASRLDADTRCMCGSCGAKGKAAKFNLLHEIQCPKCKVTACFILLQV